MFTNLSIQAPRKGKPHICKREGWWRVSPFQGPRWIDGRWGSAHNFVQLHNAKEMAHGTRNN